MEIYYNNGITLTLTMKDQINPTFFVLPPLLLYLVLKPSHVKLLLLEIYRSDRDKKLMLKVECWLQSVFIILVIKISRYLSDHHVIAASNFHFYIGPRSWLFEVEGIQ